MSRLRDSFLTTLLALLFGLSADAQAAEVQVQTREALEEALRRATAGTTIRVAAGTYRGGLTAGKLRGTEDQPIVIAGADPAHPPVFEGGSSGFHLSSPEHVELRDLVMAGISGNGLNIDDSGSTETPAHHVVLKNIVVRDVGPTGNRDGIKLSGLNDFRVERCRVERWGSSGSAIDMVGCHIGAIKNCQFANATGDAANGVQTKGGSSQIVIQRCRFQNAGGRGVNVGGSTGLPFFRPSDAPFEAQDITVEDCEFLGGMAAIAFVGVDGALVRHNTIYCPTRWPLRILQENTDPRFIACRNGRFENNLAVFRSDQVREVVNIGGKTAPETFRFSGNAWYCLDRPSDTRRLVRLPVQEIDASYNDRPEFKDQEQGDLRLLSSQPNNAGVRPDTN